MGILGGGERVRELGIHCVQEGVTEGHALAEAEMLVAAKQNTQ